VLAQANIYRVRFDGKKTPIEDAIFFLIFQCKRNTFFFLQRPDNLLSRPSRFRCAFEALCHVFKTVQIALKINTIEKLEDPQTVEANDNWKHCEAQRGSICFAAEYNGGRFTEAA
jgi:hypothetical protein